MRLSVVIPCYNEVGTIEKIVHAVRSAPVRDPFGPNQDTVTRPRRND